jgi:hypothetical protein
MLAGEAEHARLASRLSAPQGPVALKLLGGWTQQTTSFLVLPVITHHTTTQQTTTQQNTPHHLQVLMGGALRRRLPLPALGRQGQRQRAGQCRRGGVLRGRQLQPGLRWRRLVCVGLE